MAKNKKSGWEGAKRYFTKRAAEYNHSSSWVDDAALIEKMRELACVGNQANVLDLAVGTGKVSEALHNRVKYVVGLDICEEMIQRARGCADKIILAPAERVPFKNNVFNACLCRQGLQFMDLEYVISEIRRVLKPGGRVVLCHLTAYGVGDKEETFFIQKLRNPARKNFFLPDDFLHLLENKAFGEIEAVEYFTRESVNQWIANSCINENVKTRIREIYENSSGDFKKTHNLQFKEGDIFDTMKMLLVKAVKRI